MGVIFLFRIRDRITLARRDALKNACYAVKMNHEALFSRIKKLVTEERRIGVEILECLYEIEVRRAYAILKYDGLFTYCVRELGFSDSQAYQRIQAMRALKDIPELKPMIESGALSVSSVSKVQTHLRQEKKSGTLKTREKKIELFRSMKNRTSREVDGLLAEAKGEKPKLKLVFELDEETEKLWNDVKGLAAHHSAGESEVVFKLLMKEWLKRNHPAREVKPRAKTKDIGRGEMPQEAGVDIGRKRHEPSRFCDQSKLFEPSEPRAQRVSRATRVPIPAPLRREVWQRDQSRCVNCKSRHTLEIDHVIPVARGGNNTPENLRLLCRSCNQFAAIQAFGIAAVTRRLGI